MTIKLIDHGLIGRPLAMAAGGICRETRPAEAGAISDAGRWYTSAVFFVEDMQLALSEHKKYFRLSLSLRKVLVLVLGTQVLVNITDCMFICLSVCVANESSKGQQFQHRKSIPVRTSAGQTPYPASNGLVQAVAQPTEI